MVNSLFYVFTPTPALLNAMEIAEERYLAEVSVWIAKVHDRTGPECTQVQIESSFWTMFLSKLVCDDPEPALLYQLRETCLQLGFAGCWSVVCTRSGGPATELLEEATDAQPFVSQYVLKA